MMAFNIPFDQTPSVGGKRESPKLNPQTIIYLLFVYL